MVGNRHWRRTRIVVPIVLLVMILMRLVWLQLRDYPVVNQTRSSEAISLWPGSAYEGCAAVRTLLQPTRAGQARVAPSTILPSPAYAGWVWLNCQLSPASPMQLVQANQWVLVATVVAAALAARFVSGSWTLSLIVATILLSRGRLIADIGTQSADGLIAAAIALHATGLIHFIRTGSRITLATAVATAAVAVHLDASLISLLAAPLILIALTLASRGMRLEPPARWLRRSARTAALPRNWLPAALAVERGGNLGHVTGLLRWLLGMDSQANPDPVTAPPRAGGSLTRTLQIPFATWIIENRRWTGLIGVWIVALTLVTASLLTLGGVADRSLIGGSGWPELVAPDFSVVRTAWLNAALDRIDWHYGLSLLAIGLCALLPPASGLPAFVENAWAVLVMMTLCALTAWLFDGLDAAHLASLDDRGAGALSYLSLGPRQWAQWFEPLILGMGAAAVYNLIQVLDTRLVGSG